jgi:hypothetical protein
MTLQEAQQSLCGTLNISFTDVSAGNNSLFALADLTDSLNDGVKSAWDYKPWTFTEKTYQATVPSPFIGYIDYPNTFEDESVKRLAVNGPEFTKKNWEDYEKWFSDYPSDTSKFWTEHERFIFFNGNAVTAGQEVDISGKLRSTVLANSSDLLPFSPQTDTQENSGNVAIIHLAFSHILQSEKKKNMAGAAAVSKDAMTMLDILWAPMGERKAEKSAQNRPFFNGTDFFGGRTSRGNTNIGNFP